MASFSRPVMARHVLVTPRKLQQRALSTYNVQSVQTDERNSGTVKSTETQSVCHFPTANERPVYFQFQQQLRQKKFCLLFTSYGTAQRLVRRFVGNKTAHTIRYDTIDDLHWKTDRQAASLI